MIKTSLAKKMHQTDVLRQVGERDRTMRRELQEVMYEERAAKLAELEYQRRIQAEKDNNTQMLNTWKSTIQWGLPAMSASLDSAKPFKKQFKVKIFEVGVTCLNTICRY